MGLAKRRLYKPERNRWRTKDNGVRYFDQDRVTAWQPEPGTKLTEANLSLYEAELGIAAVMEDEYGVRVGRILGYDAHTNMFHCVGKRLLDRKAVDVQIAGYRVSAAILAARMLAGVDRITRPMSGR